MIKSSYTEEVLALLNGSAEDVTAVVRESLSMGSQSLLTMVPALSDVLTEALTEKCVEVRLSFSLQLFSKATFIGTPEERRGILTYFKMHHHMLIATYHFTFLQVLKQAKGIIATYRMTNRPLPSRHSPYVTSVFQPLKVTNLLSIIKNNVTYNLSLPFLIF